MLAANKSIGLQELFCPTRTELPVQLCLRDGQSQGMRIYARQQINVHSLYFVFLDFNLASHSANVLPFYDDGPFSPLDQHRV